MTAAEAEASSESGLPKTLHTCTSTSTSTSKMILPRNYEYYIRGKKTPTKSKLMASTGNSDCCTYVTDAYGAACPACGCCMTTEAQYLPSAASSDDAGEVVAAQGQSAAEGFVQGIVTYTVMDNLTVTPMSAISSITLLNTFAVRDIGDLHEKTVQLGYHEGLAILKASLQSKTVLTDVFLDGKAASPVGRATRARA